MTATSGRVGMDGMPTLPRLDSIGCTLRLGEVFDKVEFPREGDTAA